MENSLAKSSGISNNYFKNNVICINFLICNSVAMTNYSLTAIINALKKKGAEIRENDLKLKR